MNQNNGIDHPEARVIQLCYVRLRDVELGNATDMSLQHRKFLSTIHSIMIMSPPYLPLAVPVVDLLHLNYVKGRGVNMMQENRSIGRQQCKSTSNCRGSYPT